MRWIKQISKILLYLIVFILLVVIAFYVYLNTSPGKNFVKQRVELFLAKKLQTKFSIGSIDFRLPNYIEFNNVYLEDKNKDSLLSGEKLSISIALLKLISSDIDIKKISLENIHVNINRLEHDSVYNFQFILDAFAGNTNEIKIEKDTADMKLQLRRLQLHHIALNWSDAYDSSFIRANIDTFDARFDKFQPNKKHFALNTLNVNGVKVNMINTKKGDSDTSTSSSKNDLLLTANKIDIRNVIADIQNHTSGFSYYNNIRSLQLTKALINLNTENLQLENVVLKNSTVRMNTFSVKKVNTNDSAANTNSNWKVKIASVQIDRNHFSMNNNMQPKKEGFDANHFDFTGLAIHARNVLYTNDSSHVAVDQLRLLDQSGFSIDTLHANFIYSKNQLSANQLYLKTPQSLIKNNIALYFDDIKTLTQHPANSIVDIDLKQSVIAFNDLYLLLPDLRKSLPMEKFKNQSMNIDTRIIGTLQRLRIPKFELTGLNGSRISAKGELQDVTDTKKIQFDITIFPSTMTKSDLAKFVSFTPEAYSQLPVIINMNGKIKGGMNDLFTQINMKATNLIFDAEAQLKSLNNMKKFQYNAEIKNAFVEKSLILAFVPKKNLPESIELPQKITLSGLVSGDNDNILSDMNIGGSYGTLKTKGFVNNFSDANRFHYDLDIEAKAFELGKLIKKDSLLSTISMSSHVQGKGYQPKSMELTMQTHVEQIGFHKYNYNNINVNADMMNGVVNSIGSMNDPNLILNYKATANVSGEYPTGEMFLHLDTARLNALHLISDTIDVTMNTYINVENISPNNLNAFAKTDSIRMTIKGQKVKLDSIVAKANTVDGKHNISLSSPIAEFKADGVFQYDKLLPSMMQYVNAYYPITKESVTQLPPQQLTFNGIVREHPIVKTFVQGLVKYDSISFTGNYTSQARDSALNFVLKSPFVQYKNNKISSGNMDVVTANQKLQYIVKADTIQTADIKLFGTQVGGYIARDSVVIDMSTKDEKENNRYLLGATASINGDEYTVRLKNDLLLNYHSWNVAPNNSIVYSPKGIIANEFNLGYKQSGISAQSEQQIHNSPINISINNFAIGDITSILGKDTMTATGNINGRIKVSEFTKKIPAFVGDIKVSELIIKQTPIGTITLNAVKENENSIAANIRLSENENDVQIKGNYFLNHTEKQFEADMNIINFNMATIEGFTNNNISNSQGSISGKIALDGKFSEPHWNGNIYLKDPSFRLTKFGTRYKLTDQNLVFNYPNITFNQFTIIDTANNSMVVNGKLQSKSTTEYDIDLDVRSKDFIVVNTSKRGNNFIYGFAAINSNISIKGNTASPDIQGSVGLNEKTDAILVLPEKNVSKEASESVVRFIDTDTFALPEKILFVPDLKGKSTTSFINYNLIAQVPAKASLTVIIDPSTGDEIQVKGDAKLSIGVDPGGNLLLAGNYDLDQGHYILHYQFLKREFKLLSGSTIAFGGDPLDAPINIRSEYIANTSAIDLVGNELGDVNDRTANTFNQKIPFRVLLYLKGTLRKLEISFDIQMPDENQGLSNLIVTTVENKLIQLRADPAAINKQVFSLLVLNRFVGEQSSDFFKGNGGGVNDIARESVSKFLSAALDQIASDLIKGVDIDLNLNSYRDYSSGDEQQRTDLNIGITKRFMDDRLSVSVGKNLGVEGQDKSAKARQQNTASYMPDATINYKLSKDGRYMMRAYSKNKFEVIMDGYVVETGLSFIVSMDYEKFKDLFSKKKKEKKA